MLLARAQTLIIMDYVELVRDLNMELFEKHGEAENGFEYLTDGFDDVIVFEGVVLWNTATDVREWIEEENDYEPLEPYIKKKFNEHADRLVGLKF